MRSAAADCVLPAGGSAVCELSQSSMSDDKYYDGRLYTEVDEINVLLEFSAEYEAKQIHCRIIHVKSLFHVLSMLSVHFMLLDKNSCMSVWPFRTFADASHVDPGTP